MRSVNSSSVSRPTAACSRRSATVRSRSASEARRAGNSPISAWLHEQSADGKIRAVTTAPRPLLRGTLHQGAFVVALVVGPLLIINADGDRRRGTPPGFPRPPPPL